MFNRTQVCAALILCASGALAQEASTPSTNITGGQSSGSSVVSPLFAPTPSPSLTIPVPGLGMPQMPGMDATAAPTEQKTKPIPAEKEGFSLPGGFGYAPIDFTPGQGKFDRKPLSFTTTVQPGYDDNIYSSSGALTFPPQPPVRESLFTNLSQGVDVLLSQSRLGLSLNANGGGQYFWDDNRLLPNAGLNLLFAYRLTPQAQFSANVNGTYTAQPQFIWGVLFQTKTLQTNNNFNLLYRWTPRFSTKTTYEVDASFNQDPQFRNNDFMNQIVGEEFRYGFSRITTGVLEGRVSLNTFPNQLNSASNTYFALVGSDFTMTQRLQGTLRIGETTQVFQSGAPTSILPYCETSVNYGLTRLSSLSLNGRYGFNNTNANGQKSLRPGLTFTQILSPKLSVTASVNYSRSDNPVGNADENISGSMGFQYSFSKNLLLFGNFTRLESTPANELQKYTKDTYSLGLTYQY